jgi:hypothetical protein
MWRLKRETVLMEDGYVFGHDSSYRSYPPVDWWFANMAPQ